jgi:cellulose synthase/poly-beta-1,6-N-acetylglucosamine synthase-like glycosyltransferase
VRAVAVVVPARDEEHELPGCLRALAAAAEQVTPAGIAVTVVVSADSCRDRTAAVAAAHGVRVVESDGGTAGSARAAGFDAVLPALAGLPVLPGTEGLWLATTDADSRVPASWLTRQLDWAARGWDAVAGTVAVTDWSGQPPGVREEFEARYYAWRGTSPHVHGANLGFSAAAYVEVGGFKPLAVGEDWALVEAMETAGRRVLRTPDLCVVTSARRDFRAPAGFGRDLRELAGTDENFGA